MNWPQSSYSNSNGQSGGMFSGQQSSSTSSFGGGGFGTPGQQQQQPHQQGNFQQHPQQQQQQQQQSNGFGTPGVPMNSGIYGGGSGFQSSGPSTFQQHTFSTSSPQVQQQQQHNNPQQQHQQHGGMLSYQSPMTSSSNHSTYCAPNGSIGGGGGYPGGQQFGGSAYGQYQQQNNATSSQYGGSGAYGSPQVMSSHSDASGAPSAPVGRYLPGYLTASSLSGSPRQNNTNTASHDGRLSPEQQHRDVGGSFGAGSSRLFGSSTSSAGTAGRESPSRSPKQSLFSSSAYGSSRSLALTPATSSRTRRTSNNLIRSSDGDYIEEDAPPVDTLDEFDNDAGVPYVASPPPQQHQQLASASQVVATAGNASPSKRRELALPNGSSPNATGSSAQANGQAGSGVYKLVVFGYPPNLQSSVLQEFASIGPLVYNSLQNQQQQVSSQGSTPPTGTNWFTIAYDNEWAAMRALRKSGEVIAGNTMIAVKRADDSKLPEAASGSSQEVSTAHNAGTGGSLARSNTTSNLGTPATVLPASQAFLPKPNANSTAMRKSATMNKINDMGKLDASIFKQPEQAQQKPGGGVVGTLTNLIFGF